MAMFTTQVFRGMIKFYVQVENFALEVLLATLMVSKSARITVSLPLFFCWILILFGGLLHYI